MCLGLKHIKVRKNAVYFDKAQHAFFLTFCVVGSIDDSLMWKKSRTYGFFSKWGLGAIRLGTLFARHTYGPCGGQSSFCRSVTLTGAGIAQLVERQTD